MKDQDKNVIREEVLIEFYQCRLSIVTNSSQIKYMTHLIRIFQC